MIQAPDMLGSDPRPVFFPVANASRLGLFPPESRGGIPVRTWVRSLAGMQKEALVFNGATGVTWRLVSDEGPYLAGHDRAPCPLCHFISGMVSSLLTHVTSLARGRDIGTDDMELTLENFYTMQGSALQGTMTGGALDPQLFVRTATRIPDPEIQGLVGDAAVASPIHGLLTDRLDSKFTLHHNGRAIPVGRVQALEVPAEPDPGDQFDAVEMADSPPSDDLLVKLASAEMVEGRPGGVNSSLQETQSRTLHVRAACKLRDDGVKEIVEDLISPIGSEFRFLSDEALPFGGSGLAPDSVTYLSAGIGFCFMTQFGRYARITRAQLDEYRIVQDTHYHPGQEGLPGRMDPVETHVYLVTPEGEDFAQRTLDMGEQTCFLHATCRSRLGLVVEVTGSGRAPV
ncbi:MAG TPA: OsmC family protein [Acidimicrobiia bacterium]|nr:OsmC family protein [Acidimicrobiia bacterium]